MLVLLTAPWYDWPNPQHYQNSLPLLLFFSATVSLETGHALAPIVLAWSHGGFRQIVLEHKPRYILLPTLIIMGSVLIGGITSLGITDYRPGPHQMFQIDSWRNPFPIMVWVYILWNAYHFGMQNFGVLSIYRRKWEELTLLKRQREGSGADLELESVSDTKPEVRAWDQRQIDKIFCLVMTCIPMATAFPISLLHNMNLRAPCVTLSLIATGGMLLRDFKRGISLPRLVFILTNGLALALIWWQSIIGFAVYSLNHWLVAIGLSSHVYSVRWHWAFVLTMLLVGAVGFFWLIPTANGALLRVIPVFVSARLGLGFAHFLYDRWLWKMTDPRVRAAIAAIY